MIESKINPSYESYETALMTFINKIMTGKRGLKRDRKGLHKGLKLIHSDRHVYDTCQEPHVEDISGGKNQLFGNTSLKGLLRVKMSENFCRTEVQKCQKMILRKYKNFRRFSRTKMPS